MDSVVHFEIPADNLKRAEEFYSRAFGWMINRMPNFEYTAVGTTPSDENGMPKQPGSINGGLPVRGAMGIQHTVVTVNVPNIEVALERIEKLGGRTVQKKTPVGDTGFAAYFKDTENNVVGLWQSAGQQI